MSLKSLSRMTIGVILSAVFLLLIAARVDLHDLAARLAGAKLVYLALGALALGFGYTCRALRWAVMLRALEPAVGHGFTGRVLLGATALNNILPIRGGEVFRVFAFRRAIPGGAAAVATTLIAERLLDGFILLLFTLPALHAIPHGGPNELIGRFGAPLVAAAALAIGLGLALSRPTLHLLAHIPARSRLSKAIRRMLLNALAAATAILTPGRLALAMIFGVLAWSGEALCFLCVGEALGMKLGIAGAMLTMVCGTLATILPSGPGFLGAFDYAVVNALVWRGFTTSAGAAYTVLVHVELWLPITVAGLLCLAFLPGARAK